MADINEVGLIATKLYCKQSYQGNMCRTRRYF